MKNYLTVLVFVLAFCISFIVQPIKGQSIKKQKNIVQDDKVLIVDSIRNEILHSELDSLLLDNLFEKIKNERRRLKTHYMPLLFEYANKSKKLKYRRGQMRAYDRIGLQYRYDGVYDSSVYFHNLSLELAYLLNDSTQLYYNFNNLGQAYRKQDLNVPAINYFLKALRITEAMKNSKASSFTQNTLGATYVVQKEYSKAMYYFRKSTALAKFNKDQRTLSYNYGAMGEVFLQLNQLDSAMYYLEFAKNLKLKSGRKRGIPVSNHLIGQAYFAKNEMEQAEKYFLMALPEHIKEHNLRYQALCYAYLGKIQTIRNNLKIGEEFLEKGESIALSIHSFENLILIYNSLFELYKKAGKWEKAVVFLQKSENYEDSIINVSNARQLQALEIVYETSNKEQQIKLLSAENKINRQKFNMSFGLIIALIIVIVFVVYIQLMRKRQSIMENDKLKQQLMLSQMNPHFIFNALGSIQSFMYRNESKIAARYLGNFASLTRSILNYSSQETIVLSEEVKTLQNYLELEKMRMNSSFDYVINIPEEIDSEFIQIPPMMLQPFVENAIKHGLNEIDRDGLLTIGFDELGDQIKVVVTDNGIGINQAVRNKNENHRSKATEIFNQRLKILKKRYRDIPNPLICDLSEIGNGGTKVIIYLPVISG